LPHIPEDLSSYMLHLFSSRYIGYIILCEKKDESNSK